MNLDASWFKSVLTRVFSENGLSSLLNMDRVEKLYTLTLHMLTENEKYNLTAITDPEKIILNHYADCAALAKRLPKGARVLDVGCGAGFPTLPMAILRDDISVTAMDSTAKRVAYVAGTAELLGLKNVTAVTMRAEDGAKDPTLRERFDVVTARAVAELRVLSELCLPYVKVGGVFMAMKGKNVEGELAVAKRAIAILGGRSTRTEAITLTNKEETLSHPLVLVDKKEKTPATYPRPYAQISKKPL